MMATFTAGARGEFAWIMTTKIWLWSFLEIWDAICQKVSNAIGDHAMLGHKGGLSETCFKRSFLGQFADAKNIDHVIKAERRKMLEKWREAFGFSLYTDFHQGDDGILVDLRIPISEEWTEFDKCTIAAAKIFVDYLSESLLEENAKDEISRMKKLEPDRPIRGIDKLKAWLVQNGGDDAPIECVDVLRTLQSLRSKSSAHRKSGDLSKFLARHGLDDSSPREVYRTLVINPLLEYCIKLRHLAESGIA